MPASKKNNFGKVSVFGKTKALGALSWKGSFICNKPLIFSSFVMPVGSGQNFLAEVGFLSKSYRPCSVLSIREGKKHGQDCEPAPGWWVELVPASLPCSSTVLRRAASIHMAPPVRTRHCPSASAPASSVTSIAVIVWYHLPAERSETHCPSQK